MTTTLIPMTYDRALRLALDALRIRLEMDTLTSDQLEPGVVWSELQNVCIGIAEVLGYRVKNASIAVRLTRHRLPAPLRYLYDESMKRSIASTHGSGNYVVNFNLAGLLYTVRTSLKQIPPL